MEKNWAYHFFNDIINIKKFDPSNIKTDEHSYKSILIYYFAYVKIKDYLKIYSVSPFCLLFRYANGYFEEINGNKYLTLVPTDKSKEKKKEKYEELGIKIKYLLRSMTKKKKMKNMKNQIGFR